MTEYGKSIRGAECPACGLQKRWVWDGMHWSDLHCCPPSLEELQEADDGD